MLILQLLHDSWKYLRSRQCWVCCWRFRLSSFSAWQLCVMCGLEKEKGGWIWAVGVVSGWYSGARVILQQPELQQQGACKSLLRCQRDWVCWFALPSGNQSPPSPPGVGASSPYPRGVLLGYAGSYCLLFTPLLKWELAPGGRRLLGEKNQVGRSRGDICSFDRSRVKGSLGHCDLLWLCFGLKSHL